MLEQLRELLKQKKSKAFYAEKLDISVGEVEELLLELKQQERKEDSGLEYVGQMSEDVNYEKGSKTITYKSDKPLSPKELEELANVDNITTYIARTWLKSSDKGIWNYSIDVRYKVQDFYSKEELKAKLKELLPKDLPARTSFQPKIHSGRSLMVYIGDDHCGLILKDSQYGNEHSEEIYRGRLDNLLKEILNLGETFENLYLVSLGDELDGFNGFTTRGGHQLGSSSNKEQFDIYVNSRSEFYNKLFTSYVADKYILINQNNSNHSGNFLSYMANRALEMYITQVFDNVEIVQTSDMIYVLEIGKHVFGFVHGKDEKHQKTPFPLNLDQRVDNYLFEFYDRKGYSPSRDWIHTISADIHKLSVCMGKHGRYVKVPSISSGSNWIEANFGNSKPGALMEIVNPDSQNVISIPVWF